MYSELQKKYCFNKNGKQMCFLRFSGNADSQWCLYFPKFPLQSSQPALIGFRPLLGYQGPLAFFFSCSLEFFCCSLNTKKTGNKGALTLKVSIIRLPALNAVDWRCFQLSGRSEKQYIKNFGNCRQTRGGGVTSFAGMPANN